MQSNTEIPEYISNLTPEEQKLVLLLAKTAVSNAIKKGNDQKSHTLPENISRQAK